VICKQCVRFEGLNATDRTENQKPEITMADDEMSKQEEEAAMDAARE
jgi:hypothetical protein